MSDIATPSDASASSESLCHAELYYVVRAQYHNSMSAACFCRADAAKQSDPEQRRNLIAQAEAYEAVAGWLRSSCRIS